MPIFEYVCTKCEHRFEALIFGNQKAVCPKCQSKHLVPQLSVFAVAGRGSGSFADLHCLPAAAVRVATRAGRELAQCLISLDSRIRRHPNLYQRILRKSLIPRHFLGTVVPTPR